MSKQASSRTRRLRERKFPPTFLVEDVRGLPGYHRLIMVRGSERKLICQHAGDMDECLNKMRQRRLLSEDGTLALKDESTKKRPDRGSAIPYAGYSDSQQQWNGDVPW